MKNENDSLFSHHTTFNEELLQLSLLYESMYSLGRFHCMPYKTKTAISST